MRNPSIELYRILLVLGICICHSVGFSSNPSEPLRNISMMCVDGFVFINDAKIGGELMTGDMVNIEITGAGEYDLEGEPSE